MKHLFKKIFKSFIIGIFFVLGIIGGTYIYTKAFTTLSTATTGQSLTAQMWNDMIDRVSNIFWNSSNSSLEINGSLKIGNSATCNNTLTGTLRVSSSALQMCDGSSWIDIKSFTLGTSSNPATSCLAIKNNIPTSTDGIYRIKNGSNPAVQTRCDMTNGGWTLAVRIVVSQEHLNINQVGGIITGPNQSNAWKLSDSDINAIPKTTGYKLICNVYSYTFATSCVFGATSNVSGDCNPGGGGSIVQGLSTRPSGPATQVIYGYIGYNGCRNSVNTTRGSWSGQLRIK